MPNTIFSDMTDVAHKDETFFLHLLSIYLPAMTITVFCTNVTFFRIHSVQ
jgi:hypothetical protein